MVLQCFYKSFYEVVIGPVITWTIVIVIPGWAPHCTKQAREYAVPDLFVDTEKFRREDWSDPNVSKCDGANGNVMMRLALEPDGMKKVLAEAKDLQNSYISKAMNKQQ